MKQPIIITGAPRSGDIITAGILHLCGAYGGVMDKRHRNEEVHKLVREYLKHNDVSDLENIHVPAGWCHKVDKIMDTDKTWFVNSTEAALMWPVWAAAYPNAKWVIVRRKTGDIIQSCIKTAHMSLMKCEKTREEIGVKDEADGWLWLVHEYEKRFVEMITAGLDVKVMWPQRMVFGDFQQVHQLLAWTGLRWTSEVLGYVDEKLEHTRIKETAL